MKNILILFNIAFAYSYSFCQETINIKFNEAEPLWVHTAVDTTFIPVLGQPYFTKYSSLYPNIIHRNKNHLFILSSSLEEQTLDDYGFVLDELDMATGKTEWSHFNTKYVGGNHDFYHNINISSNGNIELFGIEEDSNHNNFSIRKKIDPHTGKIISIVQSKDTLIEYSIRHYVPFVLVEDSLYLTTHLHGQDIGSIDDPVYKYGINLELFDKDLNRLKNSWDLFDFDTLGPFSINQGSFLLRLNKNTIISLAYKDRYESWTNLGTKLMWTDISDPYKIKTKQIKDYTDLIPGTKESFYLHRFNAINNTIHLSHYYPNFDIQKNTCYILWLDSIGEIKTYIPIPKYGDHIYQLCDMIYANDDFAYLYAFPSITGKYGFDIIRIEHGVDSVRFISSLTSAVEGESYAKNGNIHTLYEDGYLIIGGYATKEGQGVKTALKVYCFKASDLGIDFKPVETKETKIEPTTFSIYPNPSSGNAFIKCDNCADYLINVFDHVGRKVQSYHIANRYTQIDLTSHPNGMYFVEVLNEKGSRIDGIKKVVKI